LKWSATKSEDEDKSENWK